MSVSSTPSSRSPKSVSDAPAKRPRGWGIAIGILILLLLVGLTVGTVFNRIVCDTVRDGILPMDTFTAPDDPPRYDAILVLGAGVRDDGSLSPMLYDRVSCGIELWQAGAAPVLLMSGDHGQKDYDEVNPMRQTALDAGVPDSAIYTDHAGFSTYDSLYRARDVFLARRVLIVTQRYHLFRALYIARALGLEADGVCADLRAYAGQDMREMREFAARSKDYLSCLIRPRPAYLGDAIPVSAENGALTHDIDLTEDTDA